MKPLLLLLLMLCLSRPLLAQQVPAPSPDSATNRALVTPYDPNGNHRTWSLKGKVLPFILGNGGGVSGLLGVEYGITKNQSIGVDGFLEYQESSDDHAQDTSGVTHEFGKYWHSIERAVFLNYRYYFSAQQLRRSGGIAPYAVLFLRYGKLDQYYDPLYPLAGYYQNHEWDYSAGVLLGASAALGARDRLDLDVNSGVFVKEKVKDTEYLTHGVLTTTHTSKVAPGFRLSVNLVWWFTRK